MTTEENRPEPHVQKLMDAYGLSESDVADWSERCLIAMKFCSGFTTEQLQAGSLGELVGALKKAPHPPMHAAVWNFDLYIEWAELRDAALAPFKGGNDEA